METTSTHRLLSAANGATALLGRLDLGQLPALCALHIGANHRRGWRIGVAALLNGYGLSELEQIDAIRTWAVALGGVVRLDEQATPDEHGSHRHLAALVDLPDGSHFEVWTHLVRVSLSVPASV
ncbi:hypothetical protein KGA66_27065 [Actinocrinis puniceicyclus]|uniref:Uncharacterized protein n=1 Tax=Actinocrinis puniceicyclus TaxID=977794 RepID=A0A8J8BDZ0_9ACTN|nr:hypothetical protein [Actinocrinis puniceicyclus]MBS2966727.1 hypothetical protein [Actinocrinis puniceicyclus]